jgi:hypothetical protein
MKKLSNKDLLEKIRDKLDKKNTKICNHIYEIKDKNKILSKLKKKEELYTNNNKIYARCLLKCEGIRLTCIRHIDKQTSDITKFIPLELNSFMSNKEDIDSSSSESYDEECELIGRFNGIEYFKNSNDEIITINPQNYGEIVGKKGDKLWEKIYQ